MKIVVIGGTGLIGSRVVERLRQLGHDVTAASPATGINTITGEGLAEALSGAAVVIDLANAPSFEDKAVMEFFDTAGRNLLTAEINAGVKHHIALSVVGTSQLQQSGYFRAKQVQEDLIRQSGIPFSIIHCTQFFEFLRSIADMSQQGNEVRLSSARIQPIAADDVAALVTSVALGQPANDVIEIGGPDRYNMDDLIRQYFTQIQDSRKVVSDPNALYSGATLSELTLVPGDGARLGSINLEQWLKSQHKQEKNAQ